MTEGELELLKDVGNDRIRVRDEKLWRRADGDRIEPIHNWDTFTALHQGGLVVIDARRGAAVLTRNGYSALASAPRSEPVD